MTEKEYHIQLSKGDVAPRMIISGDPGRAEKIGKQLKLEEMAFNREYRTYTGEYEGMPISVSSLGIGSPSTAIGVEEFHKIGVNTFIRVGTCGSLQPDVKVGDVVNVVSSVIDEGTSLQYVPSGFPAAATPDVVIAIRQAAKDLKISSYHEGVGHSKDAFYSEIPGMAPNIETAQRWEAWEKAGVMATEMENSTLYVLGALRKLNTGSVLAVIGSTHSSEPVVDAHSPSKQNAIDIGIRALKILYENGK